MRGYTKSPRLLPGAVAGAAAGLAGAWAMVRFNHLISARAGTTDTRHDTHPERRTAARPNDTDGTIPDEPGSMQAASAVVAPLLGRPLTGREKELGGPILHYGFGAAAGALYGAAAEVDRSVSRAAGIPYGITLWLVANEIGMPAAGFATRPSDYPLSRHAASLASHLVFGMTVEGMRRLLRGEAGRWRAHRKGAGGSTPR